MPITFWRTSTGQEFDFILVAKQMAIEVKSSARLHEKDVRPLLSLQEDGAVRKSVVICMEKEPRTVFGNVNIWPWEFFLKKLWDDDLELS